MLVRRERPHPGAQLSFTDHDGHRFQAILTDQPDTDIAYLEARHRGHARVEDRIKAGKDTGMAKLPFRDFAMNAVWLEISLIAQDLIAWTKSALRSTASSLAASPSACATGCCTSPAGSPSTPAKPSCTSTATGPGRANSPPPSRASQALPAPSALTPSSLNTTDPPRRRPGRAALPATRTCFRGNPLDRSPNRPWLPSATRQPVHGSTSTHPSYRERPNARSGHSTRRLANRRPRPPRGTGDLRGPRPRIRGMRTALVAGLVVLTTVALTAPAGGGGRLRPPGIDSADLRLSAGHATDLVVTSHDRPAAGPTDRPGRPRRA